MYPLLKMVILHCHVGFLGFYLNFSSFSLMKLLMNFEAEPGQLKGTKLATKLDMKDFS